MISIFLTGFIPRGMVLNDINDEDYEVDIKGYNITELIKTDDKIEELTEMNGVLEEEESKD